MVPTVADHEERWAYLAECLEDRMAELGIGQGELARISGVSDLTIRQLQQAVVKPRQARTLSRLSRALQWPGNGLNRLLRGTATPADLSAELAGTPEATRLEHEAHAILGVQLSKAIRDLSLRGRSRVLLYAEQVLQEEREFAAAQRTTDAVADWIRTDGGSLAKRERLEQHAAAGQDDPLVQHVMRRIVREAAELADETMEAMAAEGANGDPHEVEVGPKVRRPSPDPEPEGP